MITTSNNILQEQYVSLKVKYNCDAVSKQKIKPNKFTLVKNILYRKLIWITVVLHQIWKHKQIQTILSAQY